MGLIQLLNRRCLLEALTDEGIEEFLSSQNRMVYLGIDPTAPGLHLGNLVGLIILKHFQDFGHRPVILLGGATALIGDPSGKSKERPLLSLETVRTNIDAIKKSVEKILFSDTQKTTPLFVNNYDWTQSMDMITYLRDVGKYFRVSSMLAKESVKARLNSDEGISYTEMSYQILQAYDFYYLNKELDVSVQLGGSDQYGNITAGIEFARKVHQKKLFGITNPLLVRSDGKKFGKSEKGSIWLDENLCSSFDFYQHLLNTSDDDIVKFLKMLTFVPLDEIHALEMSVKEARLHPNELQKRLASELTRFIHGDLGLQRALKTSEATQPGSNAFDETKLEQIEETVGALKWSSDKVLGKTFIEVVFQTKLLTSKSEIRRMIKNKGVYLNGQNVLDINYIMEKNDILKDGYIFISVGKKRSKLIQISKV